jgi:hypothetical protein
VGDAGGNDDHDAGTIEFGSYGLERFGEVRFHGLFGNAHFFSDLGVAQVLFTAHFKHQFTFFRQGINNTINIFLQEFGADLFLDPVLLRKAQLTDQARFPLLLTVIFLKTANFTAVAK